MTNDFLPLGSCPNEENGVQIGDPQYALKGAKECKAYLNQLIRIFGTPPKGSSLIIKSFEHEYGFYKEVCLLFDEDNTEHAEYAFNVEQKLPDYWDDKALKELELEASEGK